MKPCLLIPCYEHGGGMGPLLDRLAFLDLPVVVVDDGSGPASREALARAAAGKAWVSILSREENGGKGAAVMSGLAWAAERGFSHALQMDADLQHDPAEAPRLLEAARRAPDALVLGCPVFDDSVPAGRRHGRKICRFWIWVETLSLDIRDPLCGFRVYPLAPVSRLLKEVRLGRRMDFDPEIAVRLHWRGVPVVNVDVSVRYFKGGISHFHVFRDNVLISWMNTRLFFGMLLRMPLLLARKFAR